MPNEINLLKIYIYYFIIIVPTMRTRLLFFVVFIAAYSAINA